MTKGKNSPPAKEAPKPTPKSIPTTDKARASVPSAPKVPPPPRKK